MSRIASRVAVLIGALVVAAPGAATAAVPTSTPITLPATVTGSTVGAKLKPGEPKSSCADLSGSVWYAFTAPRAGAVAVRLEADGDQDLTVEVFRRVRSQLTDNGCRKTDDDGNAGFRSDVEKNGTYLVRVGLQNDSDTGSFRLSVRLAAPAPALPGPLLPAGGARGTLDPLASPAAAYSARLRAGVSYVVSSGSSGDDCLTVEVFSPGTRSFDDDAQWQDSCWAFLTPDATGRYPIAVSADANRGIDLRRYALRVREVPIADLAPGLSLPNFATLGGRVSAAGGRPFALYRFDVLRRGELTLALSAPDSVGARLLTPGGRSVGEFEPDSGDSVRLRRGRYYVLVVSTGGRASYRLRRELRTITSARLLVPRQIRFGSSARLGLRVSGRPSGTAEYVIERFEPAFGWQFDRRVRARVRNGRAVVRFVPFRSGLWRVSARYLGTRAAAASDAGTATFNVRAPLRP